MTEMFLRRYQDGAYEQVWSDLLALGPNVFQEPFYEQALAVAEETMQRVRENILRLIPRLTQIGYVFGYGWTQYIIDRELQLDGESEAQKWVAEQPPVFAWPAPETDFYLQQVHKMGATLPISLYAWYKAIGSVNLVGVPPTTWKSPWKDIWMDHEAPILFPDENPAFDWERARSIVFAVPEPPKFHKLDPLYVIDLKYLLEQGLSQHGTYGLFFDLAPDEHFKLFASGGGSYSIHATHGGADALFAGEWHHTTFVNYLRACFRWGGLPGLEGWDIPKSDLQYLQQDLLEF